ncbi:hypothetical protein J3E69DRAFT_372761 [Trichoderma sp. SZMC 28015]
MDLPSVTSFRQQQKPSDMDRAPPKAFSHLSKLFSDVYSSKLSNEIQLLMSDMIARIVVHEQRLAEWRHRPWEATVKDADPRNLVFHKLSIVMILRYLNTRVLLHRPILSASLHGI